MSAWTYRCVPSGDALRSAGLPTARRRVPRAPCLRGDRSCRSPVASRARLKPPVVRRGRARHPHRRRRRPMPRAGANAVLSTTATFKLSLHPSAVADRGTSLQGARDLLDGMLMRHHDRLGGVLVSYEKPRLVHHADLRIVPMAGYVDVCVKAKVRVFTPKVGSKLVGRVNKIGVDHVGVLVHDVFNASLAAKDLPRDFVHNPAEDVWESAEDGGAHRVGVGTECVFGVKKISEYDDVLHLIGSMAEEGTGALDFLGDDEVQDGDVRADEPAKEPRREKKARKEKKTEKKTEKKKEKKAKRDREGNGKERGKRRKKS